MTFAEEVGREERPASAGSAALRNLIGVSRGAPSHLA
jgi:hypothetical protein